MKTPNTEAFQQQVLKKLGAGWSAADLRAFSSLADSQSVDDAVVSLSRAGRIVPILSSEECWRVVAAPAQSPTASACAPQRA